MGTTSFDPAEFLARAEAAGYRFHVVHKDGVAVGRHTMFPEPPHPHQWDIMAEIGPGTPGGLDNEDALFDYIQEHRGFGYRYVPEPAFAHLADEQGRALSQLVAAE